MFGLPQPSEQSPDREHAGPVGPAQANGHRDVLGEHTNVHDASASNRNEEPTMMPAFNPFPRPALEKGEVLHMW